MATSFDAMPDTARVWTFAAAAPITGAAAVTLLEAVDDYLARWKAHGLPLVAARDWRDDRFLAIAVDEAATGASGCSIDGMFRVLADIEHALGTTLVGGGAIYWRDAHGDIHASKRSDFTARAKAGEVTADTLVFDTTVATTGAWRTGFERPAGESWHRRFLGGG